MKQIILFFLIFNIFHFSDSNSNEFIWPIDTPKLEQKISSVFGESRGDHFHNGVDISSENEKILSISDGELIYSRYKSDNPFENEHGSGNSVWIKHKDKISSAYFHLKDGRENNLFKSNQIKKADVVGISGNTGHSSGSHLHFIMMKENKIIDPLSQLPKVEDSTKPQIGALILTIGISKTFIKDGDNFNNSSDFPISVQIFDAGEKKSQRRGIKELEIYFNKKLYKKASFNELVLENGKWKTESGQIFDELYFENEYYIGNLHLLSGPNTIDISVKDFSLNETKKSFEFHVNKIKRKD